MKPAEDHWVIICMGQTRQPRDPRVSGVGAAQHTLGAREGAAREHGGPRQADTAWASEPVAR